MADLQTRTTVWERLRSDLPSDILDSIAEVISMSNLIERAPDILAGQTRGRLVVDTSA